MRHGRHTADGLGDGQVVFRHVDVDDAVQVFDRSVDGLLRASGIDRHRLALEVTSVRLEWLQDRCDGTRSPTPSTGHGGLEQVVISYATRITIESVQALIERSKQKKAA